MATRSRSIPTYFPEVRGEGPLHIIETVASAIPASYLPGLIWRDESLQIDDTYSRQAQMNWPALNPGESVAWRGKPVRSTYATKDAKLTLRGIPVAAFMTFWMYMALRIPKKSSDGIIGWIFPLFGMIFVLQALYLLFGHYLRNWLEWENIEYAVTSKRTVIRKGAWRISEMSRLHSDSPIEVRTKADGAVGDIIFRTLGNPTTRGFGQQINSMFNPELRTGEFGLYAVENPNDVYRIILAQGSAAPKGNDNG